MQTISNDTIIKIPREVVFCPICKADVGVDITEWTKDYDGTWYASEGGIDVGCVEEPDVDDKAFNVFFNWHYSTPYIDWLPVQQTVFRWLYQKYRFQVEEQGGPIMAERQSKNARKKRNNQPTHTAKGAYLLAVDKQLIFTSQRHPNRDSMATECRRLAHKLHERILVLKVVAVLDQRPLVAGAPVEDLLAAANQPLSDEDEAQLAASKNKAKSLFRGNGEGDDSTAQVT